MSVSHLVVDLGGVLFRFDHARRLDVLAEVFGRPADEVHALFWESGFSAGCDAGRYASADRVRERIRAIVDFGGTDEELDEAWCAAYRPDLEVLQEIVDRCGDRTLVVFSNNGPLEEEALARLYPEVFDAFDRVLFSWRLGRCKPDPGAFVAVTAALGVGTHEILFIDDSASNVDAARAVGWRAVQFGGRG